MQKLVSLSINQRQVRCVDYVHARGTPTWLEVGLQTMKRSFENTHGIRPEDTPSATVPKRALKMRGDALSRSSQYGRGNDFEVAHIVVRQRCGALCTGLQRRRARTQVAAGQREQGDH